MMSERQRHMESLKRFLRGSVAVADVSRMLEYYDTLSSEDQSVFWDTARHEVNAELNKDEMLDEKVQVCCCLFRLCGMMMGYKGC
ncbi:protein UL30 [macacine betaherpesvirus 3]|uniref:Rh50.1 n=1 Tax=Rhesus cytomegalovirus (strain 68-1) TaxID=47929 RepID=I3WF55_RHCM6|nr:Rh50.1 [macacine betaherpesvirus 3]QMS44166.1 Rh50.1 [synthetic construct]APT39953.1 Rh50.1 [macacine betaherpesvirus 3]APT40128.1 Rh50.1 [macacine betaherpesvirus 3]APT40303.1 Rh50.1 [macacine betaherpesvirus 3]